MALPRSLEVPRRVIVFVEFEIQVTEDEAGLQRPRVGVAQATLSAVPDLLLLLPRLVVTSELRVEISNVFPEILPELVDPDAFPRTDLPGRPFDHRAREEVSRDVGEIDACDLALERLVPFVAFVATEIEQRLSVGFEQVRSKALSETVGVDTGQQHLQEVVHLLELGHPGLGVRPRPFGHVPLPERDRESGEDDEYERGGADGADLVPAHELQDAVRRRLRGGEHGKSVEIVTNIPPQFAGTFVSTPRFPTHRHHGNPTEIATKFRPQALQRRLSTLRDFPGLIRVLRRDLLKAFRRARRLALVEPRLNALNPVVTYTSVKVLLPLRLRHRILPHDQLVEQEAQLIDVTLPETTPRHLEVGLFRTHVGNAEAPAVLRFFGQETIDLDRDTEIDDLDLRSFRIAIGDEDVVRLDVEMDDPLAIRVVDRIAHLHEEFESILDR